MPKPDRALRPMEPRSDRRSEMLSVDPGSRSRSIPPPSIAFDSLLLRGLRLSRQRGHGLRAPGRGQRSRRTSRGDRIQRKNRHPRTAQETLRAMADAIAEDSRRTRTSRRNGTGREKTRPEGLPLERRGRAIRRNFRGDPACCSPSISPRLEVQVRATGSSTPAAARGGTVSAASSAEPRSSVSTSTSPSMRDASKRLRPPGPRPRQPWARWCRATPSTSPLPRKHFDRVICSEVMEHVHDYTAAARELARVTRPGWQAGDHDPHDDQRASLPAARGRILREPRRAHSDLSTEANSRAGSPRPGSRPRWASGFAHGFHTPYWVLRSVMHLPDADQSRLVTGLSALLDRRDRLGLMDGPPRGRPQLHLSQERDPLRAENPKTRGSRR